jgi:hypothetical protein
MDPRLTVGITFDPEHPALLGELRRLVGTFDPDRPWATKDGRPYRLSDRVWDAGQETRGQIDRVLKEALATGEDALVTADKLERYLNPSLRPRRDPATGRLVPHQPRRVVTAAPGRGGLGSYPARRLARTEISRAHAEAHRQASEMNPWSIGDRWNLSGNHPKADACDRHASGDEGLGKGVYAHRQGPSIPAHPQCRCFWTAVTTDDADAVVAALRHRYGLDEFSVEVGPTIVQVTRDEAGNLAEISRSAGCLVDRAIAAAARAAARRERAALTVAKRLGAAA